MREKVNTLEQAIVSLRKQLRWIPISVSKILYILSGRGRILIVIVLSFPFCQPIQIPGLSTPFGLAIVLIGLRIAFGKRVWLPEKLLSKKVSRRVFNQVTTKALWLIRKMKRWIHPRILWLSAPSMHWMHGLLICANGLFLALPLPIPFSNLAFAWSIFLVGLGMLENDGLLIIVGYVFFLIACALLILLGYGIKSVV